jgi:hypothetical protein
MKLMNSRMLFKIALALSVAGVLKPPRKVKGSNGLAHNDLGGHRAVEQVPERWFTLPR